MEVSYELSLPFFNEIDGKLALFESEIIPGFQAQRIFYIYDVPKCKQRANHSCMNSNIVFIAMNGQVTLSIEMYGEEKQYTLTNRAKALYVPSKSWIRAYNFSQDAILMGISDKRYQDCEYINDYSVYIKLIEGVQP